MTLRSVGGASGPGPLWAPRPGVYDRKGRYPLCKGLHLMAAVKTILVVDDDLDIVGALRTVLVKRGYRVLTAPDGNAGLALAERESPDLVVVDMMMPKKSGFLVLEKLKAQKERAPRVMMMTANEGSRHRAYAELLGADVYLRKPFALDVFLEHVEKLCPLSATPPPPPEGPPEKD